MKLAALFDEDRILIHLDVPSYDRAVDQLVEAVTPHLGKLKPDAVRERLLHVDQNLSLPLGYGVRLPHARLKGLQQTILALATSEKGIPVLRDDTGEADPEIAHLIFLILAPQTESTLMLQTLASIARLVISEENRRALVSTRSAARALRILEETGIEVKKAIVATDLMSPAKAVLRPAMTVRDVVARIVESGEEGLPVLDDSDELLGDVSTRMLIEIGLPKYMKLITNPEVLSSFEPFSSFYKQEDTLTAREVMNPEVLRLAPETQVEIVAHEMIAKQCERAYVVDEKKLLGVVYRKDIVRKVLYL